MTENRFDTTGDPFSERHEMTKTRTNCEGISRRDGLKLGLGGLIAGGLSGALRATSAAAASRQASGSPDRQADACILIWMDGGPSHYETFDPKPEAPARNTRPIRPHRNPDTRNPVFAADAAAGCDFRDDLGDRSGRFGTTKAIMARAITT